MIAMIAMIAAMMTIIIMMMIVMMITKHYILDVTDSMFYSKISVRL